MDSWIVRFFVHYFKILHFRITAPFVLKSGQCFVYHTRHQSFLFKITEVSKLGKVKFNVLYACKRGDLPFYDFDIMVRSIAMIFKYLPEIQKSEFEDIETLFIDAIDSYKAIVAEAKKGAVRATTFAPDTTFILCGEEPDYFVRVERKCESDNPNDYVCRTFYVSDGWARNYTARYTLEEDDEYYRVDNKYYEIAFETSSQQYAVLKNKILTVSRKYKGKMNYAMLREKHIWPPAMYGYF